MNDHNQPTGHQQQRPCPWLILTAFVLALTGPVTSPVAGAKDPGDAEDIVSIVEGFKIQEIYQVPRELGSWIRMTVDPQGRFIISKEKDSLLRVTVSDDGQQVDVEPIDAPMRFSMGLLCAFDSLYVNADGPEGTGMYRLRDHDKDGQYEDIQLLKKWDYPMHDHGAHEILLGPDGKLYVLNGNFAGVPEDVSNQSAHRNFREDLLLPRQWDATGWAVGVKAPGATVYRTDSEGRQWELFCGGMRNPYGFDFAPDGELFAFDSDMERHMGTPWERMTRITHCVSGGEYGWRGGTAKGPTHYHDHLPGSVDIGLSSPTGVRFGTPSHFPAKYKKALFALDWQYGRILAVHLERNGATFAGTFEDFIQGRPLNVTDLAFGKDGAMYFITGGRATQSKLYRVTYVGPEPSERNTDKSRDQNPEKTGGTPDDPSVQLRHQLEQYHGHIDPQAIDVAWPSLNHSDRWIRYAARIAIEHQDPMRWKNRALAEKRTEASLVSLLALARCGQKPDLSDLINRLSEFTWDELSNRQRLNLLRVYTIALSRRGPPEEDTLATALASLSPLYPSDNFPLNRELSELLVYLDAPDVITRTMDLLAQTEDQKEEMHFVFVLRHLRDGWTLDQRKAYFKWFIKAVKFKGGISVPGFVRNIRNEALATLTPQEHDELQPILQAGYLAAVPPPKELAFVKAWTVNDLIDDIKNTKTPSPKSIRKGRTVFEKVQCLACHHFAGEGGTIGPDITSSINRYSRQDLLEAILLPSKAVSDQYQDSIFLTHEEELVTGKVMREEDGNLFIRTNPFDLNLTVLAKEDILSTKRSTVSSMPQGLLDSLDKEEILNLIAYIESGADLKQRP